MLELLFYIASNLIFFLAIGFLFSYINSQLPKDYNVFHQIKKWSPNSKISCLIPFRYKEFITKLLYL